MTHPAIALSTVLLLSAARLLAGPAPQAFSVVGDFSFASEYVFRGIEGAGSSFQPSVEITMGATTVGLWTNQPVTKREANEIDLYASYRRGFGAYSVEAVGTYYFYPEANKGAGQTSSTSELGLGVSYDGVRLSPSLHLHHDFDRKAETVEAAVEYKLPFDAFGTATFDTRIFIGAVDARDALPASFLTVRDAYSYYGFDLSVPHKLNANATFVAGLHYVATRNLVGTDGPAGFRGKENLWLTVGLTVGF